MLRKFSLFPIKFYKQFLNPLFVPKCIYTPSCSAYMAQAIQKKGFLKGLFLGLWRILRCNPFAKGGFDPVKDSYKGKAKWIL